MSELELLTEAERSLFWSVAYSRRATIEKEKAQKASAEEAKIKSALTKQRNALVSALFSGHQVNPEEAVRLDAELKEARRKVNEKRKPYTPAIRLFSMAARVKHNEAVAMVETKAGEITPAEDILPEDAAIIASKRSASAKRAAKKRKQETQAEESA